MNEEISQEDQQGLVQMLAQVSGAKTQDELQSWIKEQLQKDPEFMKKAYQAYKEQQSKTLSAKFGAKLNYVNKLNGKCPDGYEMFKQGGCIKCKKKAKDQNIANIKAQLKSKNRFAHDDSKGGFLNLASNV